jgi:serine/threonine protein kinase
MSSSRSGHGTRFGRYRLLGEIGRGGMGIIYRAVSQGPEGFSRACVIKRIVPHLSSDPGFVRALIGEARLSALVLHPGIVQVYELGEVDGEYYLVMEYVDGISLLHAMQRSQHLARPVPPGVAAFLVSELAVALGYAHALKDEEDRPLEIVHRDVSPSNVMLGRAGTVKLLDFGIAHAASHVRDVETRTGALKGKFAYMSPEQAEGLPIDRRSDLFALGVVLWEALTLKRLFYGADDMQTLRLVREAKVTATGIDAQLDAVLQKALARDPQERFASGEDLAAALQPIAYRLDGSALSMRRFVAEMLDAPDPPEALPRAQVNAPPPLPPPPLPPPDTAPDLMHKPARTRRAESQVAHAGYHVKGSLVRAYTRKIESLGLLPDVLTLVSPTTQETMLDPPLSNEWVDGIVIEDMILQVEALRGLAGVREVTRAGIHTSILPILTPVVIPMLRLFGSSPHTLLSRFGQFTKYNLRGIDLQWTSTGDCSGTLRVQFPRPRIPHGAFIGFESGMHVICEVCSVAGNVSEVQTSDDGAVGVIDLRWQPLATS